MGLDLSDTQAMRNTKLQSQPLASMNAVAYSYLPSSKHSAGQNIREPKSDAASQCKNLTTVRACLHCPCQRRACAELCL